MNADSTLRPKLFVNVHHFGKQKKQTKQTELVVWKLYILRLRLDTEKRTENKK